MGGSCGGGDYLCNPTGCQCPPPAAGTLQLVLLYLYSAMTQSFSPHRGTDQVHNDWMFYLLYYDDTALMRQIIGTCASNIARQHPTPGVAEALLTLGDTTRDSIHVLRAKLVLLLDLDDTSRRHLTEFTAQTARMPRPLCPHKGSRFYTDMHAHVIPEWSCDERIPLATLVDSAQMAYLIA